MTIDREELRALRRLHELELQNGPSPFLATLRDAVPRLLDELDAKDRRIAELEAAQSGVSKDLFSMVCSERDDALLRLSIATELNVNDRKRIAELETLNAAAARAVDVMDDIGEQARAKIAALETALTDAINWIADRSSPDSVLVDRLRKLLPSEET